MSILLYYQIITKKSKKTKKFCKKFAKYIDFYVVFNDNIVDGCRRSGCGVNFFIFKTICILPSIANSNNAADIY